MKPAKNSGKDFPHWIYDSHGKGTLRGSLAKLELERSLGTGGNSKEGTMKIAVIGMGNVGATLGKRWGEVGHEVIFGVRDLESQKVKDLIQLLPRNQECWCCHAQGSSRWR